MSYHIEFDLRLAAELGENLAFDEDEEVRILRTRYKSKFTTPWFSYSNVDKAFQVIDACNGNKVEFVSFNSERCKFIGKSSGKEYALSRLNFVFKCPNCDDLHKMIGNPARRQNKHSLLCEQCYKSNLYKTDEYQSKFTSTMMSRHGVARPLQSPEIHQRFVTTCERNLGVSYPMQSASVRATHKANMLERHGVSNWFEGKNPTLEWPTSERAWSSEPEKEFVACVLDSFDGEKAYSFLNRQFFLMDRREGWCYSLDLYMPLRGCVLEFYGDYWHANPTIYPDDKMMYGNKTAKQVRENNLLRESRIMEKLNCRVRHVWEYDVNQRFDSIVREIVEWIRNG